MLGSNTLLLFTSRYKRISQLANPGSVPPLSLPLASRSLHLRPLNAATSSAVRCTGAARGAPVVAGPGSFWRAKFSVSLGSGAPSLLIGTDRFCEPLPLPAGKVTVWGFGE